MALASRLSSIEDVFNGLLVSGSCPVALMMISIIFVPYMVVRLLSSLPWWAYRLRKGKIYYRAMHSCASTRFIVLVTEYLSSLLCALLVVVITNDEELQYVFDRFSSVLI